MYEWSLKIKVFPTLIIKKMVNTRSQKRTISECDNLNQDFAGIFSKKVKMQVIDDDQSSSDESSDNEYVNEESKDESSDDETSGDFTNQPVSSDQLKNIINETIREVSRKHGNTNDPYIQFDNFVESIYDGNFFTREPLENKLRELRDKVDESEIQKLNDELKDLRNKYKNGGPSILEILKMNTSQSQKQKLLESMHLLENSDILTQQYNSNLKYLTSNLTEQDDTELIRLEEKIAQSAMTNSSDSYKHKILKSKMSFENKVIAYKNLQIMQTYEDTDNSDFAKYKNWMDSLLSIPFGILNKIPVNFNTSKQTEVRSYMKNIRNILDEKLSFLEKPKDQIINVVTQMVRNSDSKINAIGLYGPKGCGKSSIVASIAKALNRPYQMVSLGGESDASTLTGHGFTYIGSNPGRIIDVLRHSKTMNPIVLLDELDKISETQHGKEIIGTLIHLTDTTTNNRYNLDKYFSGIEFDLSKVLFVFTYNDPTKIDKILSDRLYKIKIDNYTKNEKIEITNKHLIRNILKEMNFEPHDITFSDNAIRHLVETSSKDEGMRDVKTKITIIISRINNLLLTSEEDNIIKLGYKKLYKHYKSLPVVVPNEHIDTFLDESITDESQNYQPPFGMYV